MNKRGFTIGDISKRNKYILFITLFMLLYYFWILIYRENDFMRMLGANIFPIVGIVISLSWAFQAFQQIKTNDRYFWLLLCIAYVLFIAAQSIWFYYQIILQVPTPYPSWADFIWLIEYGFLFVAIIYKIKVVKSSAPMVKWGANILIFMVVAVSLSIPFLIQPILEKGDLGLFRLVSLTYPIFDLGFLLVSVSLYYTAQQHMLRKSLLFITTAYLIQILGDVGYIYLNVHGLYKTGSFIDPLWLLPYFITGYAGIYAIQQVENPNSKDDWHPERLSVYPLISVLMLMIISFNSTSNSTKYLNIGIIVATIISIFSTLFIQRENTRLLNKLHNFTNELERTIIERTGELQESHKQLMLNEKRYRQLIEISPNFIIVLKHSKIALINRTGMKLLGVPSLNQVINKSLLNFLPEEYHEKALMRMGQVMQEKVPLEKTEYEVETFNGLRVFVEVSTVKIDYDGEPALLIVGQDITERKKIEEKMQYSAHYDMLTGLPNRLMFHQSLQDEINKGKTNKFSLLFVDLDGFKVINDTLGHNAGDILLQEVAIRLSKSVDKNGKVFRLGGDEFTIIVSSSVENEDIRIARDIVKNIAKPFYINTEEVRVTSSIGISIYPDHADTPDEIVKTADAAMYAAKEKGKNSFQVFHSGLNKCVHRKNLLENEMKKALDNDEFSIVYQPQFHLQTNEVVGLEALLRWNSSTLGSISPNEFVPIAEQTGMIISIGKWVFQTVLYQINKWKQAMNFTIPIAINISAKQFENEEFIPSISQMLHQFKIDPKYITLELTESIMQNTEQSVKLMGMARLMGLRIAIDDFGKGYSSLGYLKYLPIDYIKIDKSFIDDVAIDKNDETIVKTIIDMGQHLNIAIIAEGIENESQVQFLVQHNCQFGQGYFYSRPLSTEDIEILLHKPS